MNDKLINDLLKALLSTEFKNLCTIMEFTRWEFWWYQDTILREGTILQEVPEN